MGRRQASIHDCLIFKSRFPIQYALHATHRRARHFSPPACFISALALGLVIGGGAAVGDPSGSCTSSVPGVDLTCTGTVINPSAFTATSDFTVDIGTTTPDVVPAEIEQDSGFAGIKINAGNHGGSVTMTEDSSIAVDAGSGSSRNGLVIASNAAGTTKTYTIDIDGSITSAASQGDGVRLEGTSLSVFNATFGRDAVIGGGTGDDAIMVTGAQSLMLKNYGLLQGGSGQPGSGGEGINVGNHTRIAADGVTIDNRDTITGTGDAHIDGGQGITVFGAGDVSINNGFRGDITGATQGVRVEADGAVSITNRGHIEGLSEAGVEVADGAIAEITNSSRHTIEGATDGVSVHDVDAADIDNDHGRIIGHDGDGVHVDDIDGNVSIKNRFGSHWNAARISGSDDGVHISDVAGEVSIDNRFKGKIIGGHGDGVAVRDAEEDVAVANGFGGRIEGGDDGIDVRDARGDVTISNVFGGVVSGRRGDGVRVEDTRDDVAISNVFGGQIRGRDDGVHIEDVRDDVAIDNSFGGSIVGRTDDGVDIDDAGDDVEINNWFGGKIWGRDNGVQITDSDDDVKIDNRFAGVVAGWRGDGLRIQDTDGSVSISNSVRGEIFGDDDGIHINGADDDVRIDNRFGGAIAGRNDDGIDVRNADDDVRIDNRFGGTVSGDDNGIKVHDVDDDVTIANSFGGKIRGSGDNGIDIDSVNDVRIDNRAGGSIRGRNDGIHTDDVEGDVRVDNGSGSIRGRHGDGIDVSTDEMATVNNGFHGRITGRDSAIEIEAGQAEINSSGLIRGSGEDDPTIALSTEDGATINNKHGGLIVGDGYAPTSLIVAAEGGAVTINNDGRMIGRIDLSDAGNTQVGNVFNNTSDHSWIFTGISNLGNGLSDMFENSGTAFTTDPGNAVSADVTQLTGVETFNNGTSLKAGTIDLQDGFTGDVTTLSPTEGGALAFYGTPGKSFLKVDSFLGAPSDSSSDQLIIDGSVSGQTALDVNNVNPGFGSYNPIGIEVVSASGSLAPNNFVLKNGPIDTGLFDYDLYLAGSNDWVLASTPNRTFFELPSLMSAAQSMWQQASGVWLDRTADLRFSLSRPCVYEGVKAARDDCPADAKAGAWVKVLGATESRSPTHSFSLFDTKQTYTTEYDQSGGGVIAGFDLVHHADDGRGIWLAGVMGGYLRSVVDFENSATNADFESGAVGGYVTYLQGPWFLDAKLMANIGSIDYSGSHAAEADANVTSIGGVLDTGYRIDRGRYFIEPGATLSYVSTDIDNLAVYGTSVNFASGDSLRGRLGIRLGTTFQDQQAKYEPFLGLSAWYEFLGDNSISLVSNEYALRATDDVNGAIGEVSGGVNVYSLVGDGVSGFLKGNLEFGKDDYLGFAGSFGVRVDW